jgi:hypothetical protein
MQPQVQLKHDSIQEIHNSVTTAFHGQIPSTPFAAPTLATMSEPALAIFAPFLHTKRLTMVLLNLERDVQVLAETMNVFLNGKDGFEWTVERARRLVTNLTLSPTNFLGLKAPGPPVSFC